MSAFFVGRETINATATLILKAEGPRSTQEMNRIGKSLWMMNALALEQRYERENAQDYLEQINGYAFEHVKDVTFAAVVKAARCFLYQCSEGDVPEMALFKKLDAIAEQYAETIDAGDYEAAPWGLCG